MVKKQQLGFVLQPVDAKGEAGKPDWKGSEDKRSKLAW